MRGHVFCGLWPLELEIVTNAQRIVPYAKRFVLLVLSVQYSMYRLYRLYRHAREIFKFSGGKPLNKPLKSAKVYETCEQNRRVRLQKCERNFNVGLSNSKPPRAGRSGHPLPV